MASIPKVPATSPATKRTLSYQLRELIEARGLCANQVATLAGVDQGVVSRFLRGVRDIRMETADRIAAAMGLRLVEVARPARPQRRKGG